MAEISTDPHHLALFFQRNIGHKQKMATPQIFGWLKTNVWEKASLFSTEELIQQATGESLNTQWFRRYLEQRYTKAL